MKPDPAERVAPEPGVAWKSDREVVDHDASMEV
jgi:hypothetical protein